MCWEVPGANGVPADVDLDPPTFCPQVCWEKFCRYFDVEERFVPLEEGCYVLTAEKVRHRGG